MNVTKRKKVENKKSVLWDLFDQEIGDNVEQNLERLFSTTSIGNRDKCELCGSSVSFSEDKFLTCTNRSCGIIYKDILDRSAEWRYYGAGDSKSTNPTRCGMPINPLLKESSYGCKVVCNGRSTYEMRKIRRYTEWQSMPYKEKTAYEEFQKIKALSNNAGIPKLLVDDALRYHKKISEMKTFRGCNRDGVIAASIYIASRISGYPRTAREIATIFHLDNTSATKGCKNAGQILNNIETNLNRTRYCETKPENFIERFCR